MGDRPIARSRLVDRRLVDDLADGHRHAHEGGADDQYDQPAAAPRGCSRPRRAEALAAPGTAWLSTPSASGSPIRKRRVPAVGEDHRDHAQAQREELPQRRHRVQRLLGHRLVLYAGTVGRGPIFVASRNPLEHRLAAGACGCAATAIGAIRSGTGAGPATGWAGDGRAATGAGAAAGACRCEDGRRDRGHSRVGGSLGSGATTAATAATAGSGSAALAGTGWASALGVGSGSAGRCARCWPAPARPHRRTCGRRRSCGSSAPSGRRRW